jgi:predicted chitinase
MEWLNPQAEPGQSVSIDVSLEVPFGYTVPTSLMSKYTSPVIAQQSRKITISKPCFCNRDFTVEEMTHIITQLRKSDDVRPEIQFDERGNTLYVDKEGKVIPSTDRGRMPEKAVAKYRKMVCAFDDEGIDIFNWGGVDNQMREQDANIETLVRELNAMFKEYEINTCLRKIHFLAQAYHETLRFHRTYEQNAPSALHGGEFYRGRGLIHLSHQENFYNAKAYMQDRNAKEKGRSEVEKILVDNPQIKNNLDAFVRKTTTEMHFAVYSSGAYWGRYRINQTADGDDILKVSARVNNPSATTDKGVNGAEERTKHYNKLKEIFEYDRCINKK